MSPKKHPPMKLPDTVRTPLISLLRLAREHASDCQARQLGYALNIQEGTDLALRHADLLSAVLRFRKTGLSPKEAERRINSALRAVVRGADDQTIIMELESFFTSKAREFTVHLPVGGIAVDCLPFTFGGVQFSPTSGEDAERLLAQIPDLEQRTAVEQLILGTHSCMAHATETALDNDAARSAAMSRIRDAIDVLNYWAPLVEGPTESDAIRRSVYGARVFLSTDGSPRHIPIISFSVEAEGISVTSVSRHGQSRVDAWFPSLAQEHPTRLGIPRLDQLLRSAPGSGLGTRILRAVKLIGRANAEPREDEALLFYVAALEAAVVQDAGELTYKTSINVASLFGPAYRKWAYETVSAAYKARSKFVHGDSVPATEGLLDSVRQIANAVVRHLMMHFQTFDISNEQLASWLLDRLFATSELPASSTEVTLY